MNSVKRRVAYYLVFIGITIVVASVAYDFGMRTFEPGQYPPEGTELSILHSMQVVVETFTATGYGSDSPWQSAEMNLLVMLLDITGVALFFLALPAVLLPLFRETLSPSLPAEAEDALEDHVIICSDTSRAEALIGELESNGVAYLFVEPDRDRAIDLQEDDYPVVHADPQSVTDLQQANISAARAVIADLSDRVDASIVLAAKEAAEDVRVISVIEDDELATYHRLAGADDVLTPRRLVGEGLARKVRTTVRTDLGETIQIGEDFEIAEVPLYPGSELAGQTLEDSGLRERYGVNVIGVWVRGDFETPPPPDTALESGTILLVTGEEEQLERLRSGTRSTIRRFHRGKTIVAGHGKVGRTVTAALAEANLPYTVVDREERASVDVVGDATDPDTLREADVESAGSIIFTLPDDTATEFATLVVRDIDPSTEIIARAEKRQAVRKTYRAGADYVLSLATVSGRSIASRVVDDEKILSLDMNVEVVRTKASKMAGETLRGTNVRERTGCMVVAVERDGEVLTDIDPDFRFRAEDELVIAGTDEGTNRFFEYYR